MELSRRTNNIISLLASTWIFALGSYIFTNWTVLELARYIGTEILLSFGLWYIVISGWFDVLSLWVHRLFRIIYEVLSLSIFTRFWRLVGPRLKHAEENLQHSGLCAACRNMVLRSNLLCGSWWRFTMLVELHNHHGTFEKLSRSADDCHLCAMVTSSIKQQDIRRAQGQGQPGLTSTETTPLLGSSGSGCRIKFKIWEQRPLNGYTYLTVLSKGKPISERFHIREMPDALVLQEDSINQGSTSSQAHVDLAKEWLNRCNRSHNCLGAENSKKPLPRRLVKVKGPENEDSSGNLVLHLIETSTITWPIKYVAVSYCWGGFEGYKLTASTYDEALHSIPEHQVPQTLRDALHFACRLGIPYVWIDSLCIVQGDSKDSAREIAQMHNIYTNAYVTIAAAGASSSNQPLYRTRDPRSLHPCPILGRHIIRNELGDFETNVEHSPLSKRGWVFQERLLSPRTLHFGPDMLYWECSLRSASEIFLDGFTNYNPFQRERFEAYRLRHIAQRPQTPPPGDDAGIERAPSPSSSASELPAPRRRGLPAALMRRSRGQNPRDSEIYAKYLEDVKSKEQDFVELERQQPAPWDSLSGSVNSLNAESVTRTRFYEHRSWAADMENPDVLGAGFKAALDSLRRNKYSEDLIDSNGFHQCWFELVAVYSRGQLTQPDDKLNAFKGITRTIADATDNMTLFGVWEKYLLVNLLWFSPEGAQRPPRYRAPTWSWASLDGPISHSLLPPEPDFKTSLGNEPARILSSMLTYEGADRDDGNVAIGSDTSPFGTFVYRDESQGSENMSVGSDSESLISHNMPPLTFAAIRIMAKSCKAVKIKRYRGALFLIASWERYIGRFYPDVLSENLNSAVDLVCIKMLSLKLSLYENREYDEEGDTVDIQGLVLSPKNSSVSEETPQHTHTRVGFFTTKPFGGVEFARDIFKMAEYQRIELG